MPQDRLRKLNDENRELAKNLKKEMDNLRQRASTKAITTSSKKKAAGSDLSSTRGGSEERHSSVPATGRGQKRGRDFDFDKVGDLSSPSSGKSSLSSLDSFLDHPDSPPGSPCSPMGVKRPRTMDRSPLDRTGSLSNTMGPPPADEGSRHFDEILSSLDPDSAFPSPTLPLSPSPSTHLSTSITSPPLSVPPPSLSPSRPLRSPTPVDSTHPPSKSPQNSSSGLSSPPRSPKPSPEAVATPKEPTELRRGRSSAFGQQGNEQATEIEPPSAATTLNAPSNSGPDRNSRKRVNLMRLRPEYPRSTIENPYTEAHPKTVKLPSTQEFSSRLAKRELFQCQEPSFHLMIAGVPLEDEEFKDDIRGFSKSLPRKKPRVDTSPLQEEAFHSRSSVRIPVPDHVKSILVDDWENVTKNLSLVPLPSNYPVNKILTTYFDEEKGKRRLGSAEADLLEEVVAGVKEYFAKCLGRILLYRFEREQFFEVRQMWESGVGEWEGKGPGDVYGAEHLCRLFGKYPTIKPNPLPSLLTYHEISNMPLFDT